MLRSLSSFSSHGHRRLSICARAIATIERPTRSAQQPEHYSVEVVTPSAHDVLAAPFGEDKYQDYEAGMQKMRNLEKLSKELLDNLEELNKLDALPTFPEQSSQSDAEKRRMKRAASREARKAAAAAPAPPKSEPKERRLESLVLQPPAQEVVQPSKAKAPASMHEQLHGRTSAVTVGPSLLPMRPTALSVDDEAGPSSWAKTANAKRARLSSRRAPVPGAMDGVVRASSRSTSSITDGTSQFMKKATSLALLDADSEKELTTIVKDLLFIKGVRRELKGILKRNPTMQEWSRALNMDVRTFEERLETGEQAKAMMLKANYRLVISVCKKYQNRGIALQDLITEGMQGLIKGVEKFDPTKGFRFSTYAHWWIRQAVTRSLSDQGRTVRLPAHILDMLSRIQTAKAALTAKLGKEPSLDALAKQTDITPLKIKEVLEMVRQTSSLDAPAGDEDGMDTMKDMIEDTRSTPDEVLEDVLLKRDMSNILGDLTERQASIIRLRFGLDGEPESTLEDIGARLNLTRERIRQIEAQAVRTLRMKQREALGILKEYSSFGSDAKANAPRRSQGTNKK